MNKLTSLLLLSALISGTSQASLILTPPPSEPGTMTELEGITLGSPPMSHGGIIVGNGGFAVQCSDNSAPQSFDFLFAQDELGQNFRVREVNNTDESLQRIRGILKAKLPALVNSFDIFTSEILNADPSGQYIWEQGTPWLSGNMLPLDEAHMFVKCPDNPNVLSVITQQIVLRKYVESLSGARVVFEYDASLYYGLPPIQRTFLLVHEWLWNFTTDYVSNNRADYLLHSTWIETASQKDVIQTFKEIGVQYP